MPGFRDRWAPRLSWLTVRPIRTTIVLLTLFAIWEAVAELDLLNPFLFPPPTDVVAAIARAFVEPPLGLSDSLLFHIGKSLERAFIGWVIGCTAGILFGMAVEWSRGIAGGVGNALLEFARPVPSILALPVLTILLGLSDWPRILVIAWGAFIFVAINTIFGVRNARKSPLPEVIRSFGGGGVMVLRKAIFGLAWPQIVAGMRQAVGIALILMVASELVLATNGIGWFIGYTRRLLAPPLMYGSVMIVGFLGLLMGALFRRLQRFLLRGYGTE